MANKANLHATGTGIIKEMGQWKWDDCESQKYRIPDFQVFNCTTRGNEQQYETQTYIRRQLYGS